MRPRGLRIWDSTIGITVHTQSAGESKQGDENSSNPLKGGLLFVFECSSNFMYTNSLLIGEYSFNSCLLHDVKKVLNFVVDVLEFRGLVCTSRFMFLLGGSGLIA